MVEGLKIERDFACWGLGDKALSSDPYDKQAFLAYL
jgi:hypothetical protein